MNEESATVKVFAALEVRAGLTSARNRLIWQGIAACYCTMFDLISGPVAAVALELYG
jgi:hypothetical protein